MEVVKPTFGFLISGSLLGAMLGFLIGSGMGTYSSTETRDLITGLALAACSTLGAIAGAKLEKSHVLRSLQGEKTSSFRRRLRFGLRMLFVLMTVVCLYLGWAMNWIRLRHACLAELQREGDVSIDYTGASAPWPIRLLGEQGVARIEHQSFNTGISEYNEYLLFPEAYISGPDI